MELFRNKIIYIETDEKVNNLIIINKFYKLFIKNIDTIEEILENKFGINSKSYNIIVYRLEDDLKMEFKKISIKEVTFDKKRFKIYISKKQLFKIKSFLIKNFLNFLSYS